MVASETYDLLVRDIRSRRGVRDIRSMGKVVTLLVLEGQMWPRVVHLRRSFEELSNTVLVMSKINNKYMYLFLVHLQRSFQELSNTLH